MIKPTLAALAAAAPRASQRLANAFEARREGLTCLGRVAS